VRAAELTDISEFLLAPREQSFALELESVQASVLETAMIAATERKQPLQVHSLKLGRLFLTLSCNGCARRWATRLSITKVAFSSVVDHLRLRACALLGCEVTPFCEACSKKYAALAVHGKSCAKIKSQPWWSKIEGPGHRDAKDDSLLRLTAGRLASCFAR